MTFFNTVNLEGDELEEAEQATETQEERVLGFFQIYRQRSWTPWEVHRLLYSGANVPITSVRRAIKNLTDEGKLVKTDEKRQGPYGKPSYTWKIKPEGQLRLF